MALWGEIGHGENVEEFLSEENLEFDQKLVEWDVLGSIAHTQMLHEQGYLTKEELGELHRTLLEIPDGEIDLTEGVEDIHTAIEEVVTGKTAAGKKMHTGRSRNDQVAVDERLYMKKNVIAVAQAVLSVTESLAEKAGQESDTVMPGYTHMQQAMPTTAGTWLGSFAEALVDDLKHLEAVYGLLDQNPLGAAAGYGTVLDTDPGRTAELLGFSSTHNNPVYAVGSRKKAALQTVQALAQLMLDLETLANDLLLFSTQEFGFVELPPDSCTGSSIMPQKNNPDVLEMVKAKTARVLGNQRTIETICHGAFSGYGRESQGVKAPMMESLSTAEATLHVLAGLVAGLEFDAEKMEESLDESTYAAYTANQLVEEGVPFREAYREVKNSGEYKAPSPGEIPSTPIDTGRLEGLEQEWEEKAGEFGDAIESLLSLARENAGASE